MDAFPPSELILNADGSVYHLALRPEHLADTVFTVGDPDRVERVARHFDAVEFEGRKREFRTCTGRIGQRRFTVLSTGIGTDNIDIALNELDALASIDLEARRPLGEGRSLTIVRLGTSGSLQPDVPVDALVLGTHGLGLDGLLGWYADHRRAEDPEQDLGEDAAWWRALADLPVQPYLVAADPDLLARFPPLFHRGVTATCPGFYAPQGRQLRLRAVVPDLPARLGALRIGPHRVINFEMETAAIYGLGRLLGHRCLSANVILANRATGDFSSDPRGGVDRLIEAVLGVLA
jgi:uridine phosphorylase